MMVKQNRTIEKGAAGDSGALDDIVDFASNKMSRVHATDPKRRQHLKARAEKDLQPCPATAL